MSDNIKTLHRYLKVYIRDRVFKRFNASQIISEVDLQAYGWRILPSSLMEDEQQDYSKVREYLKNIDLFPDIVMYGYKGIERNSMDYN